MDRRRAARRVLTAAAFAGAVALPAAPGAPPLAALRWTEPTMALDALTRAPPECLALPGDPVERARIEVGRAAFRAPGLLGGQAARLGLSCESCHVNGRGNAAFRFPGLSGAPGTADVTAPMMSAHRGDEVFDPKPIPDLVRPGKIGRAPGDPALGKFVRGLIVEEFDGRDPPPAVLDGLVAYVRAIHPRACPAGAERAASPEAALDAAMRAVAAARGALVGNDRDTARLLLGAARGELGRIAERYAQIAKVAARLEREDARLLALQRGVAGDRAALLRRIDGWLASDRSLRALLVRHAARSLYEPAALTRALRLPSPPR